MRNDLAFVVGQIISKTSFYRQKILKSPGKAAAAMRIGKRANKQVNKQGASKHLPALAPPSPQAKRCIRMRNAFSWLHLTISFPDDLNLI